jgi:hypothetical protein
MASQGSYDPEFLIVSALNPNICVTAGTGSGGIVTLQNITNPPTSAQLWSAAFQINQNGSAGIAVINSASGTPMSVTSQGTGQPLVMEPFSSDSGDQDSWNLVGAGQSSTFRLVWPVDNGWSWNDWNGKGQPGDKVALYNDRQANSVWLLATPSHP